MDPEMVTVQKEVLDRVTRDIRWAVQAGFVQGERGDPVCVEYRVQLLRGANGSERLQNLHRSLSAMQAQANVGLSGQGPFPDIGIPRYVFEAASQGRLLEEARASLSRGGSATSQVSPEARAVLAAPAHRPGRPPQRSLSDKLRILASVEDSDETGETLQDVSKRFGMSRSALRDLLSWARHDAQPRLFEGRGQGRRGGQLTADARALLRELDGEV